MTIAGTRRTHCRQQRPRAVFPGGNETGVPQEVVWDCSNWNVADMEDGLLLPYSMGEITITATSAADDKVKASITIKVGMF